MKAQHAWRGCWDLFSLLLLLSLAACGTLEVGIERTPTPDQEATAAAAALVTENTRLAEQVATLTAPTPALMASLGKLAYVRGGDIWVKALPDGEARRLTADGRNSTPRWSPSGQWLAFRKGESEQVWVIQATGRDARSLQAVPRGAFAWSPVADRLAYADGDRLKVINADGVGLVTLVAGASEAPPTAPPNKESTVGRIAWSADGAWIAYEWCEKEPDGPLAYQGLWKVPASGGEPMEVYRSGAPEKGEAILAGWPLGGEQLLFWQGDMLSASFLADGVALYSLGGGGEPLKLVDTVLVHDDFLASAPQGERLAVTAGSYRATWTNKRVAVIEAGGGALTWLTDESVASFSPAWSPDGGHLATVAMPDRGDLVGGEDARLGMMERRIRIVDMHSKLPWRQLTNDPAYRDERPLWSGDGSFLLFARLDAEDRASLWLIPAGGGEPQQVVDELTPTPEWFGYYGYVGWDALFDWWRGPSSAPIPEPRPLATLAVPTAAPTLTPLLPTPSPSVTPWPTLRVRIPTKPATMDVQVYFAHSSLAEEGTCVKAVTRRIPYTLAVGRAAIEELLEGPTAEERAAGFWSAIPDEAEVAASREGMGYTGDRVRLKSLRIVDGVASADFSAEMEAYGGGSARVMCLRQEIIWTLKQFSTVREVVISVEGRTEDVLQP